MRLFVIAVTILTMNELGIMPFKKTADGGWVWVLIVFIGLVVAVVQDIREVARD